MSPSFFNWTSTPDINAPLPAAAARPALGGTITILGAPPASTTPYWQHPPPGANRAAAPSPPATAGNPHRCHPAAYGMRHLTHSRQGDCGIPDPGRSPPPDIALRGRNTRLATRPSGSFGAARRTRRDALGRSLMVILRPAVELCHDVQVRLQAILCMCPCRRGGGGQADRMLELSTWGLHPLG